MTPDWQTRVRELTAGRGANIVVENSAPATLEQSIQSTAISGEVSIVGWLPSEINSISISSFYFNLVNLRPIYTGNRAQFVAMLAFIAQHHLHPVIDRVFPFADARAAFQYYETSRGMGKVVISHQR
jgi:NADPH:quinone reductase-like Zn-dependent oxidoreductase